MWHSSRYSDGHLLGFFFFCWGHQRKATSHTFQNFNILKHSTPFDSQFCQAWQRFRVWSLESKFSFSFLCGLLCFSFCLFPFKLFLKFVFVFLLFCSGFTTRCRFLWQTVKFGRKERNFNQSKRELVSIPIFPRAPRSSCVTYPILWQAAWTTTKMAEGLKVLLCSAFREE